MTSLLDKYTQDTDAPRKTFSDKERYEWIRGHRGDPVTTKVMARRRGETASLVATPLREPGRGFAADRRDDGDSWTLGRMQAEQNLH